MAVSRLGSGRLTWMRGQAEQFQTDTAEIMRTTLVTNAAGGQTETETVVATVPCRLQEQRAASVIGQERAEGGRVVAVTEWRAFLPAGTDVRPADRLLVNGTRYEVIDASGAATDTIAVAVSLRRVS